MSTDKTLMRLLAQARPQRLDPDPARRPQASALMAYPRGGSATRPARRPARRLVLASLLPATAIVAVGALVLASHGTAPAAGGSTATQAAPGTAHDLLLVAAQHSASSTATSGKYVVVSQELGELHQVGPASRPYHVMLRNAVERWYSATPVATVIGFHQSLGAAPATPGDAAAWRADGSPKTWVEPPPANQPDAKPVVIDSAPGGRFVGRLSDSVAWLAGSTVSAAELAALPSEPAALRQWLLNRLALNNVQEDASYTLFVAGTAIVLNPAVRAQVRAAAYQMLADLDGVTSIGQVKDQHGRSGVAVGYARKGDGGHWAQSRLVIDPKTGQALADEDWDLGSGSTPAATGELLSYTLVTGSRYTSEEPPTAQATPRG
jgi:hypothetical protein